MELNLDNIGKRIHNERDAVEITQGDFAETLGLSKESRQSVSNWENGRVLPDLELLYKMCEIFNCELGYLLCEYDCKKKENADVNKITGLSEKSINKLKEIKNSHYGEILITLDKLMERDDFYELIKDIHIHALNFNDSKIKLNENSKKVIADVMNYQNINIEDYLKASSKSLIKDKLMELVDDINIFNIKKQKRKQKIVSNDKKQRKLFSINPTDTL